MNNEMDKVYRYEPEFSQLDTNGFLKPSGIQSVVNTVAGLHLKDYGVDFATLINNNLSWVLLSLSVEMVNPIEGEKPLFVNTWYSENKGIFYRRELQVKNEGGDVVFNCATYSTILDLIERKIYRAKTLPFKLMEPQNILMLEARPTFKGKYEYTDIEVHRVQRSYIDGLGHVNNGRYGDFCYDSLTEEEADMSRLQRMELYFVSELRPNDSFTTQRAIDGRKTIIHGLNNSSEKSSFFGTFEYK